MTAMEAGKEYSSVFIRRPYRQTVAIKGSKEKTDNCNKHIYVKERIKLTRCGGYRRGGNLDRGGGGRGKGATGDKQPTCTTTEEKSSGKPKDRDSTHDRATAKVRYLRAD
jgi:hypothetical protein